MNDRQADFIGEQKSGMMNSDPEKTIAGLYRIMLGREPDAEGLRQHSLHFQSHLKPEYIALAIASSSEFAARLERASDTGRSPDQDTFYYFHIAKTAGMSVHAYIHRGLADHDRLFPGYFLHDVLRSRTNLQDYWYFSGHFMGFLDEILGKKTRKATTLRDPFARIVSHYRHALRDPSLPLHRVIRGRTLLAVLNDDEASGFARNFQSRMLAALVCDAGYLEHTLHLRRSITCEEDLYETARAGLAQIEVVGIQEDLKGFLDRLSSAWNLSSISMPPEENVSRNSYDLADLGECQNIVEHLNAVDYRIYEDVRTSLASPS